jgi:hypothetical protein
MLFLSVALSSVPNRASLSCEGARVCVRQLIVAVLVGNLCSAVRCVDLVSFEYQVSFVVLEYMLSRSSVVTLCACNFTSLEYADEYARGLRCCLTGRSLV